MKHKRLNVGITEVQNDMLQELMTRDGTENISNYIGLLIANKYNDVFGKVETRGRPKKVETESEIELLYPAPDGSQNQYTKLELEAYYAFRNEKMPKLPRPIGVKTTGDGKAIIKD